MGITTMEILSRSFYSNLRKNPRNSRSFFDSSGFANLRDNRAACAPGPGLLPRHSAGPSPNTLGSGRVHTGRHVSLPVSGCLGYVPFLIMWPCVILHSVGRGERQDFCLSPRDCGNIIVTRNRAKIRGFHRLARLVFVGIPAKNRSSVRRLARRLLSFGS